MRQKSLEMVQMVGRFEKTGTAEVSHHSKKEVGREKVPWAIS